MIGQSYDEKKKAVLDICRRYLRLRGDTNDGVRVEGRMKDLESSRYVLAVVGEAKAGKSTFINALLGESILPTDILQSSSAVVEIFKSKEKYVEVEYADGTIEKFKDNPDTPDLDEAAEHLRNIGAVRYRDIPATLIDEYILEGRITPSRPLPIAALEAASKQSLRNNEALIREYVQGRTPSVIPRKITFGFPLKYAFEGLRLVDTPGVSAQGGLQDVTYKYIEEANAVLFIHSLESPIESGSFYDFVNNIVPNRSLKTLFFVLTNSGMKSQVAIDEKIREAYRQYGKKFDHDRILHVDSMLKIVSEEIEQFDRPASLKEHYRARRSHFEKKHDREQRVEAIKFDIKLNLLNKVLEDVGGDSDLEVIQAALRQSSNFDEMERIIDDFSNQAPELLLSDILESVKIGFDEQKRDLDENISALEKKRKHPQTFEREISKIQCHLKKYQASLLQHVPTVDVRGIEDETKESAFRTVEREREPSGFWENVWNVFTLGLATFTDEKEEYDEVAHLEDFTTNIRIAVKENSAEFWNERVPNLIGLIASDFESALEARIDARDKELEAIKTAKETNEEIQERIVETKKRKEEITEPKARVSELLSNLP